MNLNEWKSQLETKVADSAAGAIGAYARSTEEAIGALGSATNRVSSELAALVASVSAFADSINRLTLPSASDAGADLRRRIALAIQDVGLPTLPTDPGVVANELADWAKDQLGRLGPDVQQSLERFRNAQLWLRIDGDFVDDPASIYARLLARMEARGRPVGDSFKFEIGGLAVAPIAAVIHGAQARGSAAVRDALRQLLFSSIPALQPHVGSRWLTPNPGDAVLIVALVCIVLIAFGLGLPLAIGGGSILLSVAFAIQIALANGDEIEVEASNPLKLTTVSVAGVPVPVVELGSVIVFRNQKRR